jgi:hypothetical protein
MRRFLVVPVVALVAFLLVAPTQLRADGFDSFTFTDTTIDNNFALVMTWQLPASPTPDAPISNVSFAIFDVSVWQILNGVQGTVSDSMVFLNASAGYPFQFFDQFASLSGVNLYSGDETSPTFIPGTYSGFDVFHTDLSGTIPASASLTIATPEPSSVLLLCIGFLAFAGGLTLKKAAA